MLTDAFARCRSEQTAQLVTLVGVPGIGESRLVAELFALLDADPEVYWWRQGRSLPYGESQSFWALGEVVKGQAGILETDDADAAREKPADMLAELGRGRDFPASGGGPWLDAGNAVAEGEYAQAAEAYRAIGARLVEHWARLLAAEAGDVTELEASYPYLAEQQAAPFLRRCEALLPATA